MILHNVTNYSPKDTASHLRIFESLVTPMQDPHSLKNDFIGLNMQQKYQITL